MAEGLVGLKRLPHTTAHPAHHGLRDIKLRRHAIDQLLTGEGAEVNASLPQEPPIFVALRSGIHITILFPHRNQCVFSLAHVEDASGFVDFRCLACLAAHC